MKKAMLGLAVILSFGSAAMAQDAQATGEIRFTGEILKTACTVAPVADISLGSIAMKVLNKAGSASPWTPVKNIAFTDCNATDPTGTNDDGVSTVELAILPGTPFEAGSALWAKTGGDATNVGLELKVNNVAVSPEGEKFEPMKPTEAGTLNVPVQARLKSVGNNATAGTFETTVSFTATYK